MGEEPANVPEIKIAEKTWSAPVAPTFEDKFVKECVIEKDGGFYELWHNPKTGAYETRPVSEGGA